MNPTQLRAWREAKGLSQNAVAHLLGVSYQTYWRWECGRCPMPPYLVLALIGLFPEDARLKEVAA